MTTRTGFRTMRIVGSGLRTAALLAMSGLMLSACSATRSSDLAKTIPSKDRLDVARAAAESGQTDIALSMYASAAKASPDDPSMQSRYAGALIRAGYPQQAESVLDQALKRHSHNRLLLGGLGNVRLALGDAQGAIEIFDRILSHHSDDAGALNGRGVALDMLGHYGEAKKDFEAVLKSDPANVASANNLALSLMLQGRASEAVPILTSLARQEAVPQRVLNNLGLAQAAAGNGAAADRILSGRIDQADIRTIALNLSSAAAQEGNQSSKENKSSLKPPQ